MAWLALHLKYKIMICVLAIIKNISADRTSERRWAMAGFSIIKLLSAGTTAVLALRTVAGANELRLSHQRPNKGVRQKLLRLAPVKPLLLI